MPYGYIQELPQGVVREHVRYQNRYGLALAADLYYAEDLDQTAQHPALIVGAPYGGVKEQGPAVYAGQLAQKGFVVLTFDQPYMGESAGDPRNVSSPELFAESFSAAVDYLGVKVPFVNRQAIGAIGLCGSGGFLLSAAAVDPRIKAIATASLYDISDLRGMMKLGGQELEEMKKQLAQQRWDDFAQGQPLYLPTFPETPYPDVDSLPETDPLTNEWNRFYAVPRGHVASARGGFTVTSGLAMLQFSCLTYIEEISPRPILFIYGEEAHSRSYSERAYQLASEPKQEIIVPDCEHIDLYDNLAKIPFEAIASFFSENLS